MKRPAARLDLTCIATHDAAADGTEFKGCEKLAVVKNARLAFKLPSQ